MAVGIRTAMSEYSDTLAWLYRLEAARGMDFKLERVALALRALGDPQHQYPCLHVAGTNGKGSVAAMLHAILQAAGHRVGLYTSPHLLRFTERIRIGGEEISETEVVAYTREIHSAATIRGIELTFFEFVTAIGLLAFARRAVDCAVIEVGLGGRLDATNVIDPEAAVITTIGRDHQEYLGDTITAIAAEKGGIIKPGRPVVIGRMPAAAKQVLRDLAAQRGASLVDASEAIEVGGTGTLRLRGLGWDVAGIKLGLRGRFQIENAATALAAAASVRERFGVTADAVRAGLAGVRWPGRLEVVSTAPLLILDGAHNEDGIATVVAELPVLIGARPLHLLFAVMRDKHWHAMVERLGPVVRSATVTSVLPPRGEPPERVAAEFRRFCPVETISDPRAALAAILARVPPDAAVLVTGSLYLVGAVSGAAAPRPQLPVPAYP
ncbi:MAG: bifunctional folylpolyglutamate synthase/dihydrofolate synthase [Deltaproteobacteria bacterium]|nr:bifunctional folylpolyglutamate synthase/dihydrofolate synthase [Deltaproteobacteria bacterium]